MNVIEECIINDCKNTSLEHIKINEKKIINIIDKIIEISKNICNIEHFYYDRNSPNNIILKNNRSKTI